MILRFVDISCRHGSPGRLYQCLVQADQRWPRGRFQSYCLWLLPRPVSELDPALRSKRARQEQTVVGARSEGFYFVEITLRTAYAMDQLLYFVFRKVKCVVAVQNLETGSSKIVVPIHFDRKILRPAASSNTVKQPVQRWLPSNGYPSYPANTNSCAFGPPREAATCALTRIPCSDSRCGRLAPT